MQHCRTEEARKLNGTSAHTWVPGLRSVTRNRKERWRRNDRSGPQVDLNSFQCRDVPTRFTSSVPFADCDKTSMTLQHTCLLMAGTTATAPLAGLPSKKGSPEVAPGAASLTVAAGLAAPPPAPAPSPLSSLGVPSGAAAPAP